MDMFAVALTKPDRGPLADRAQGVFECSNSMSPRCCLDRRVCTRHAIKPQANIVAAVTARPARPAENRIARVHAHGRVAGSISLGRWDVHDVLNRVCVLRV